MDNAFVARAARDDREVTMTLPIAPGGWTIEDLHRFRDDGNRYEIFDGSLLVTPPASVSHVFVQGRLMLVLNAAAPAQLIALDGGAGISVRGGSTYYVPDIVVARAAARVGDGYALDPGDVELAVEVLSPFHRGRDLLLKRHDYAAAGIPAYWIVDPKARNMTVLTLDPAASSYRELAVVAAGQRWQAEHPYPVMVDPADFC